MLRKQERAPSYLVARTALRGRRYYGRHLTLRTLPTPTSHVAFVVPKHIARTAALRNTLRRRGYAATRNHIVDLPKPHTLVFFFKERGTVPSTSQLEKDVIELLDKVSREEYTTK
jgi:ribonuclease P protein component